MDKNTEDFFKNIEKILDEADYLGLSNFTYDLFDCIYSDIVAETATDFSKNIVEAYANEIRNSLEIMNPDLKSDIEMLEKVLIEMERYVELG